MGDTDKKDKRSKAKIEPGTRVRYYLPDGGGQTVGTVIRRIIGRDSDLWLVTGPAREYFVRQKVMEVVG